MRKLALLLLISLAAFAQQSNTPATAKELRQLAEDNDRNFEMAVKQTNDVLWYFKCGDVAQIDKVLYTSKPARSKNPTAQGAGNPMILPAYVFTPKNLRGKAPLIVFVHGGVHGDFETSYAHIIRELMEQGYVVIAPEYRGSTGYGEEIYEQIDYWPDAYQVAYAGVPVSDLVERMGYKSQGYRNIFAEFIGKQAVDDPDEYKRRSPAFLAGKLATPLLVHT